MPSAGEAVRRVGRRAAAAWLRSRCHLQVLLLLQSNQRQDRRRLAAWPEDSAEWSGAAGERRGVGDHGDAGFRRDHEDEQLHLPHGWDAWRHRAHGRDVPDQVELRRARASSSSRSQLSSFRSDETFL